MYPAGGDGDGAGGDRLGTDGAVEGGGRLLPDVCILPDIRPLPQLLCARVHIR